jgi:hypothetical protein
MVQLITAVHVREKFKMKTMYRSSKRRVLIIILLSVWVSLVAYSQINPDFQQEVLTPVLEVKK